MTEKESSPVFEEARKSRRGPKSRNATEPICIAIRELRDSIGETQEAFSRRLHITLRTAARWETVRPPKAYATLSALATLATENGCRDLVGTFCPSANKATEYKAWVVAARPFLKKAIETDPRQIKGDSVTLFLIQSAAVDVALATDPTGVFGFKVWRVLVRFEQEPTR